MSVRCSLIAAVAALVAATAVGCSADAGQQPQVGESASTSSATSAPNPTKAATKPVQPPTKGNTTETVPAGSQKSSKPVDLDKPSTSGDVVGTVTSLKAVKAKAQLPGEVAGPGLLVSVRLRNESKKPIQLDTVLVTLYDSSKAPGGEMTSAPNKPMKGTLQPGKSAEGDYLFTVPTKRRSPVVVNITLPTGTPVMVFRGDAPRD